MSYPGGKSGSGVYQAIINLMPPHKVYIEAFLGGGAIMRLKKPALANIAIDADARSIETFEGGPANLQLVCGDALAWLSRAGPTLSSDTLIYLDPPYLMSTRSCKRPIYAHEFSTIEEHAQLLDIITGLPSMVMISGYWSELYADRLKAWRSVSYQAQTRSGRTATEWVWCNFPAPLELHDYRYLGRSFRERERIKRQQLRWKNRIQKMPDLERHAILAAIDEIRAGQHRQE